jgi:hypothetical protein
MNKILYKITDWLGWVFHSIFFELINIFYPHREPPKPIERCLDKIYCIGNWFYNINKEIN